MTTKIESTQIASELRLVLARLTRRLRAEHPFPVSHAAVLGRLDRQGPLSVSDLASAELMKPQSMATTVADLEAEGYVTRRPDPEDRRRAFVELTESGRSALEVERRHREGWLAGAIAAGLTAEEQALLIEAVELLARLVES